MSAIRRASASARAYLLSDRPLEFVYYSNPRYFVILRTYSLVFIVLYTLPAFDFCLMFGTRAAARGARACPGRAVETADTCENTERNTRYCIKSKKYKSTY